MLYTKPFEDDEYEEYNEDNQEDEDYGYNDGKNDFIYDEDDYDSGDSDYEGEDD